MRGRRCCHLSSRKSSIPVKRDEIPFPWCFLREDQWLLGRPSKTHSWWDVYTDRRIHPQGTSPFSSIPQRFSWFLQPACLSMFSASSVSLGASGFSPRMRQVSLTLCLNPPTALSAHSFHFGCEVGLVFLQVHSITCKQGLREKGFVVRFVWETLLSKSKCFSFTGLLRAFNMQMRFIKTPRECYRIFISKIYLTTEPFNQSYLGDRILP